MDEYSFSVSTHTNGDVVIAIGRIFAMQMQKDSISKKYRGYELKQLEYDP